MPSMLDRIRMLQSGTIPPPPVATLVGFTLGAVEPGSAVVELEATERHANPMGTVHGGILCDVADAAMGMAWAAGDRKSTRLNSSHSQISYAVFCLQKKTIDHVCAKPDSAVGRAGQD